MENTDFKPFVQAKKLTDDEYFADKSLSQSALKMFWDNPLRYKAQYIDNEITSEKTAAMSFGTLFHELAANDFSMSCFARKPTDIVRVPEAARDGNWVHPPENVLSNGNRRGKKYLEWKKDVEASGFSIAPSDWDLGKIREALDWESDVGDKTIVTDSDYLQLERMGSAMLFNRYLEPILAETKEDREVAIMWLDEMHGIRKKAKLDLIRRNPGLVIDWKTTTSLSLASINHDIRKYKYHWQAKWYSEGFEALHGSKPDFVCCFIDKMGYGFVLIDMSLWIERAKDEVERALSSFALCQSKGFDRILDQGPVCLAPPKF